MCYRLLPVLRLLFIACVCTSFSSCQKLAEYLKHPGDADYKDCAITKITAYNHYGTFTDTLLYKFYYNRAANPDSIVPKSIHTGSPKIYFIYDSHNRLIQVLQPYNNNSYESWSRYVYNAGGQIVGDSTSVFGLIVNGQPQSSPAGLQVRKYEYDGQGRMIHATSTVYNFGGTGQVQIITDDTYSYDANNNLVRPGVTYDSKLSVRRTNAIWMFLAHDYSVNNPFTASQYNSNDLPTHVNFESRPSGEQFYLIPNISGRDAYIDYQCK